MTEFIFKLSCSFKISCCTLMTTNWACHLFHVWSFLKQLQMEWMMRVVVLISFSLQAEEADVGVCVITSRHSGWEMWTSLMPELKAKLYMTIRTCTSATWLSVFTPLLVIFFTLDNISSKYLNMDIWCTASMYRSQR